MDVGINLISVYVSCTLGLILSAVMLIGNRWRFQKKDSEGFFLKLVIICIFVVCLLDPFVCTCDGKKGVFNFIIVHGGNLIEYLANVILGASWLNFVSKYLNIKLKKTLYYFFASIFFLGIIALIINVFVPLIFSVDENNVYQRGPLFFVYILIQMLFIVYSLFLYIKKKMERNEASFFYIILFVFPAVVGILLQSLFYGISMIWPCLSISMSAVINSFLNENLYKDNLTKIYNRSYFEEYKRRLEKKKEKNITAMMLDMNDFKYINDTFGHTIGDDALIRTAEIFTNAIKNKGIAIRYAGDEFIIILNTQDENQIQSVITDIRKQMDDLNESGTIPYKLSVSIGYSIFDIKLQNINDLLSEIDFKMYEDKQIYYQTHQKHRFIK